MAPHFLLSGEATFSAAHTLPGVEMCDRMHGHNWRFRITVRVPASGLDAAGMGVDFRVLERTAREIADTFEHRYLNDLPAFRDSPPSAERIARVICDEAEKRLAALAAAGTVEQIELWEMPQYRVIYRPA